MTGAFDETIVLFSRSTELSILVKATVALGLGLAAIPMARRARASTRHLVLASTFGALLLLPLALMVIPAVAIQIPVTPAGNPAESAAPQEGASARLPVGVNPSAVESARWSPSLSTWIRTGWAIGALLLLASLAAALWRLGRVLRYGLPWPERHALVRDLAADAGLRRPVEILLHEDLAAPLTCGFWHPTILLPSGASEWSEADVRRALVHELEHVRRADWAIQLIARTACALYWFHPLAWVAWRRLCLEAECACDDAVLQSAERTDYAEQLVQLARRLSNAEAQPALAMANRSDLSTRVAAILDTSQRRGRVGVLPVAAAAIGAAVVVLALAPVRAVAVPASRYKRVEAHGRAMVTEAEPRHRKGPLDQALYEAAESGDLDGISALFAAGANVNCALDGDGSPLIGAARSGELAAVRLLLDEGADPDMSVRGDGSPLIMAASEGHADVVELLLNRGASIEQVVSGDENALIQASGNGHLRVVRLLVGRGADVNARVWVDRDFGRPQGEWRSPLSMAQRGGHDAVVAYLLSVGAGE